MDHMVMLRNTRRNVVDTTRPHVTPANLPEYERAVMFIRRGTIDACNQTPYHQDYDKWSYSDQLNYESGRLHIGNLISAINKNERETMRQEIVRSWPEHIKGIPFQIEKALGFANKRLGSAYPEKDTIQPDDPNVPVNVTYDRRGRLSTKIPTVLDE
jgi:hypothetical protein